MYDSGRLDISPGGMSVINTEFNIALHHEFPRDEGKPGPIRRDWRDFVAKPRERTAYLAKKFLALNAPGERILFVRDDPKPLDEAQAQAIRDALARLFPKPEWRLALIQGPQKTEPFDWRGDPAAWDFTLAGLDAELTRPAAAV